MNAWSMVRGLSWWIYLHDFGMIVYCVPLGWVGLGWIGLDWVDCGLIELLMD